MSSSAYVRVSIDLDAPAKLGYRPIGADLEPGVYGSADSVLSVHFVTGDGRENAVRARLSGDPAPAGPYDGELLASVALSGFGWRHICEADDPEVPAGDLFGAAMSFGTPTIEAMLNIWEAVEDGGAQRVLSSLGFPEGSVTVACG